MSKTKSEAKKQRTQERERLDHAELLAKHADRTYYLTESVGESSVYKASKRFDELHRLDSTAPLTLVINSPGGSVLHGFGLFDHLRSLSGSHKITTIARGMAASMGGVLLQAGDERVIGANTLVLIHEVSYLTRGTTSQLQDDVAFTKRVQDRCLDILASRSTLTKKEIRKRWVKTDWWLDAKEAVKYGFADRIEHA